MAIAWYVSAGSINSGNQSWNKRYKRLTESTAIDEFFFVTNDGSMYKIEIDEMRHLKKALTLNETWAHRKVNPHPS